MARYTKVISVDKKANLTYADSDTQQDLIAHKQQAIAVCHDKTRRQQMEYELAQMLISMGNERDAADALCHVVESASPKELSVCGQEDNQSPVAKAFCALRGLACSHDEYVWETASQAVSAVLHHLHHE